MYTLWTCYVWTDITIWTLPGSCYYGRYSFNLLLSVLRDMKSFTHYHNNNHCTWYVIYSTLKNWYVVGWERRILFFIEEDFYYFQLVWKPNSHNFPPVINLWAYRYISVSVRLRCVVAFLNLLWGKEISPFLEILCCFFKAESKEWFQTLSLYSFYGACDQVSHPCTQ